MFIFDDAYNNRINIKSTRNVSAKKTTRKTNFICSQLFPLAKFVISIKSSIPFGFVKRNIIRWQRQSINRLYCLEYHNVEHSKMVIFVFHNREKKVIRSKQLIF